VAIRLVRQAQAAGLASEHIDDYVTDRLGEQGLGDHEHDAARHHPTGRGAGAEDVV
jgi:hypothetical protein